MALTYPSHAFIANRRSCFDITHCFDRSSDTLLSGQAEQGHHHSQHKSENHDHDPGDTQCVCYWVRRASLSRCGGPPEHAPDTSLPERHEEAQSHQHQPEQVNDNYASRQDSSSMPGGAAHLLSLHMRSAPAQVPQSDHAPPRCQPIGAADYHLSRQSPAPRTPCRRESSLPGAQPDFRPRPTILRG